MKTGVFFALVALAFLVLVACGGGGAGGGGGGGPNRPVADPGPAQTGDVGQLITFDGSASAARNGTTIGGLAYAWTLTSAPAGSTATLTNSSGPLSSIRPDLAGTYVVSLVVANGINSSSDPASTTLTAVAIPVEDPAQVAAQLSATLDVTENMVRLDWRDSFPAGTSYRIESRNPNGTFSAVETIAGIGGGSAAMTWQRLYTNATTFRVWAIIPGKELSLLTQQGQRNLPVSMPSSISIGEPAFLTGGVDMRYDAKTSWSLDQTNLGPGTPFSSPGAGLFFTLDTTVAANGRHVLTSRTDRGESVFSEFRQFITTSNPNLALNASSNRVDNTLNVDVRATSQAGVTSVTLVMDGGAPITLTSPNVCLNEACEPGDPPNAYRFTFNTAAFGSGNHTASATAIDGANATKTLNLPFSSGPGLVVTPVSGTFVSGMLQIQGTTSSNIAAPVSVTAFLGGTPVLQTTNASFSGSFDLAGVMPGKHTLTVSARDSAGATTSVQRPVVVASSAGLAHQPLFQVDEGASLLAAFDDRVVYVTSDGTARVRHVGTSAEMVLAGPTSPRSSWAMTSDWIYAAAASPACAPRRFCMLRWSTSNGSATSLTNLDSRSLLYQLGLAAQARYLVWKSSVTTLLVYDVQANTFTQIGAASGSAPRMDAWDFAVGADGTPTVYMWTASFFDLTSLLSRWTPAGTTSVLSANEISELRDVKLDSATVAYHSTTTAITGPVAALATQPRAGGPATTIASAADRFLQRDGVLLWQDAIPGSASNPSFNLRVTSDTRGPVTLVNDTRAFGSAGSGFAVFHQPGSRGTFTWNGASGVTALRVDGEPLLMFITGNWMYFKLGAGVYRVSLG